MIHRIYLHINTSGNCFDEDKIDSISAIEVNENGKIRNHFYEDIPVYASPSLNQKYHFRDYKLDKLIITNEFINKLVKFKKFVKGKVLISHYKYYENEFLIKAFKFAGLKIIENEWIDLQENIIIQNDFGGDVYDVAKKLNLSFNENNNFFSVANAVSDLHIRMLN
jgi:DNA polymerase III alpha subunit (gram-positive type)